jgi:hypothetical protein
MSMSDDRRGGMRPDDDVQEESTWRLPLLILITTIMLSGIVLYWYVGPTVDDIAGNTPSPSEARTPIGLTIGGVPFVIPENYTQYPRARRGGERDLVALYAMFPEFHGYVQRADDGFKRNSPASRVVHFQIESQPQPLTEAERLQMLYLPQVTDPNGIDGPHGLMAYDFAPGAPYPNETLFTGRLDDGGIAVLRCTNAYEGGPPPSCRRDMEIAGGLALSYRFQRAHLDKWRDIDAGVQILVESFRDHSRSAGPLRE